MSAQKMDLPKWLRQAVKDRIAEPQEAWAMYDQQLLAGDGWGTIPEDLWPLAQRLSLWRAPARPI